MKLKKLICLFLAGIALTGCFGNEKLPMTFSDNFSYKNQIVQYLPADYVMLDEEAFTSNLCIVEKDYKEEKELKIACDYMDELLYKHGCLKKIK